MGKPASPASAAPTAAGTAANEAGAATAAPAAPAPGAVPAAPRQVPVTPAQSPAQPTQAPAGQAPPESTVPTANTPAPAAPASISPSKTSPAPTPPGSTGSAPRPVWKRRALAAAVVVLVAVAIVLAARWLRTLDPVQEFLAAYPGEASQPSDTPVGLPAWLGWQHFLNFFFLVLIVRTGLQVRTERKPAAYWTAKKDSFFSPKGNTPRKVSLTQWLHQSLDVLWVANGLVFMVLLFATGQWKRIVPTSWDVFPNMASTALQYASLDWPTENGWVHYNALQLVAYFSIVFLAAPLAILSGIRMSTWWPQQAERLNKAYPVEWARAVHVPVMVYFVAFTLVHVFLVFFTGALRNLNHMFAARDTADWWGLGIFVLSLLAVAAGWFLTKPLFMTAVAGRMGRVGK
nr:cytochrome b/b6 domain-containing protein [Arthrobacter zhangbolii]